MQILTANGLDLSDKNNDSKVIEILEKYEEVLPKSNAHQRLCIDLIQAGDVFK